MVVQRGDIWWASLGPLRGSGPGRRRPVVVVSANAFNRSAIRTVIVAVITSNERLAAAPGNVRLTKRDSGLSKVSVVNVSQVITLDRSYLSERVKRLPSTRMDDIDIGLGLSLGLQVTN